MAETITPTSYTDYGTGYRDSVKPEKLSSNAFFRLNKSGWAGGKNFPRLTVVPNQLDIDVSDYDETIFNSGTDGLALQRLVEQKSLYLQFNTGWFYSNLEGFPVYSDEALYSIPETDSTISLISYHPASRITARIFEYEGDSKVRIFKNFRVNVTDFDDGDSVQCRIVTGSLKHREILEPTGTTVKTLTLTYVADTSRGIKTRFPDLFRKKVTSSPAAYGEWRFSSSTQIQYYDASSHSPSFVEIEYWRTASTFGPYSSWLDSTYYSSPYSLGTSNGEAYQTFVLPYFPAVSLTVYVNGTSWTQTETPISTAGNYVFVNKSAGVIQFGGGGNYGTIPTKGSSIKVSFKAAPLIVYEPSYSSGAVTATDIDLLDAENFETFGYITVVPKSANEVMRLENQDVANIVLTVASGTTPGTPLLCTVTATDFFGRPVRNAIVQMRCGLFSVGQNILSSYMKLGRFHNPVVRTNEDGRAYTYFVPSDNLYSYICRLNLYNRGTGETNNGSRGSATVGISFSSASRLLVNSNTHPDIKALNTSAGVARVMGFYDNDEWNPYNFESRTGGRAKLILSATGVPLVPTITGGVVKIIDANNIRSLTQTSGLVQIGLYPASTQIWAIWEDEGIAVSSDITTRSFTINTSTISTGSFTVGTSAIQQAGYLDPLGSGTWS